MSALTPAVRKGALELRCRTPRRTVGLGRVFLLHLDAFGERTVRHEGLLELEYVEPLELFEVEPREVRELLEVDFEGFTGLKGVERARLWPVLEGKRLEK